MTKNNIHCLAINDKNLKPSLAEIFNNSDAKIEVEIIADDSAAIINKLRKKNIWLFFTSTTDENKLRDYKKLLSRYSMDTILVNQAKQLQALRKGLSGLESCSLIRGDTQNNSVYVKNLLKYSQLKRDFRLCKNLLSITDQRNRWLVNITAEPIAYIYKGTHIHANAAYLSLLGFQSMAELKSTSIADLIPKKSKKMFKRFMKKQQLHAGMQQTLLMTMNSIDNSQIRVGIRIAPAVINKTKCTQLWIHRIDADLEKKATKELDKSPASPWENLPEKKVTHGVTTKKSVKDNPTKPLNAGAATSNVPQSFSQLKASVKSIKLKLQPLTDTHSSEVKHYFVKLQLDAHEQLQINQQLQQSGFIDSSLFWDRLLLLELTKQLSGNQQTENQFLLSLTATSVKNNAFITFVVQCLKLLPPQHPQLIFLIPHQVYMTHPNRIRAINQKISNMNCSLGIYNFTPDRKSLQRVLKEKPAYISYSSKWVKSLTGKQPHLDKLTRLTEQLEEKGIEAILP